MAARTPARSRRASAQSSWGFVGPEAEPRFVAALTADLASGAWDDRWGVLRTRDAYDVSLRLIISHP